MKLDLQDKVVVITGPAKGMGQAISLAFAEQGAKLVLTGRDTAAIEEVALKTRAMGVATEVVRCDLTDPAQTEAMAQAAQAAFGRIDVLVNVAGGSGPIGKTGWETSHAEFQEIVELNMTGCFNTMHAVLPSMISQRAGKVVNVGGTFGMRGRAGRMAYSASKWGLRGITKSFALEAGPFNINVNCVAPGSTLSEENPDDGIVKMRTAATATRALKRVQTPEDLTGAIVFFASADSDFITGQTLVVDGGSCLH